MKILVLLFDKRFVQSIVEGRKTVTRRVWKRCNLKVGSIQTCMSYYTKEGRFAKCRISKIERQKLGEMTEQDAKKEGFESLQAFKGYWQGWKPEQEVWVITFELEEDKSVKLLAENLYLSFSSFGVGCKSVAV